MASNRMADLQPAESEERTLEEISATTVPTPGFVPAPMFGESLESFQKTRSYNNSPEYVDDLT